MPPWLSSPALFYSVFIEQMRRHNFPSYRYQPAEFLRCLEAACEADEGARIQKIHSEVNSAYDATQLKMRLARQRAQKRLSREIGLACSRWLVRHGCSQEW